MSNRGGQTTWDLDQYRSERARPTGPAATGDEKRRGLRIGFDSDPGRLFWMAFWAATLTVLTLGLYRFWMVTKLRRHYWSAIRIAGDPLEYTGRGLEKLLGFLLAMVILAIYLGVVNLGLAFAGLSIAGEDPLMVQAAFSASALAVGPLLFYASYRAAAYKMSRTRWRGIRFGMSRGAWGYTLRGILLCIPVVLTAGLAYPWLHYRLEKYRTDRAWFGSLKFEQSGGWFTLFSYWIWIYILGGFIALAIYVLSMGESNVFSGTLVAIMIFAAYVALFIVFLRYRVNSFRHFWNNKTLGGARFTNDIDTGDVIGVMIGGSMLVSLCATAMVAVLGGIVVGLFYFMGGQEILLELQAQYGGPGGLDGPLEPGEFDTRRFLAYWPLIVAAAASYLLTMIATYAFTQIFLTRPLLRRKVMSTHIIDTQKLGDAQQRANAGAGDAGGFADALGLDVGGAF